ncbi:sugar O-acetyltransferase [Clostridium estertheticum]|uniref:Acetyltransferase n=1 Tax=Clostridium estertheticum TaxID=238834 RepID=A0AA47I4H3_9CLOT|nr:sugar O-acetyltransferase [Clostridium estertheticum]MBU3156174.1 sugar O-acetyltransferase [Clostridium estertheticum]MBU3199405.1 sugar O-acetyltransferase [Clostridium estertheticum]WAG58613.1 sugar O-acetyltransferase [Clostridium estertheticum]WAG67351.1 sugar O-acetyltransferase [Clostridium estertheticum]
MCEKQKMLNGEIYNAYDKDLILLRNKARHLTKLYNNTEPEDVTDRINILKKLFGKIGDNFEIEPPFNCDYGTNIHIGETFYANFNFLVLDDGLVTIGDNVLIAPNVSIFTATHLLDPKWRPKNADYTKAVTIGNNVWIGGGCIINPGITIGDNSVIGSGSVVTKDIPANVVAVGNPCKILKKID